MMYAITQAPDVEMILVDEFRAYFQNEVKTSELFRNYPAVRVSQTHPFAHLVDAAVNNTKVPVDLFPSITIVVDSDSKAAQTPALLENASITDAEIQHILDNREQYIISDQTITALEELLEDNAVVFAQGGMSMRGLVVSIEIWADNADIKNKLYDLCQAFVVSKKRYDVLSKYDLRLNEHSMTGQKSGQYNFDFGKLLYGGSIRVPADVPLRQYFVDADQSEITSVVVSTGGVY